MRENPKNKNEVVSLSRRGFIARTAAASFAIMSPTLAFGSQANSRVTVGFIGLGGRGNWIASALKQHDGFQITAVSDYFEKRSKERGQWLDVGIDKCFSGLDGYKGVIDNGVDAVFLETPPYCFPEHATAATAAGCHVFMAKPVACDVPGCQTILEMGKRSTDNGKVFLVDFQTRTSVFHQEAMRRIHDGGMGRLAMISTVGASPPWPDPPLGQNIEDRLTDLIWVNDRAIGGDYVVNFDIHAIDLAMWMANDVPVSVMAYSARNRPNANGNSHDTISATYEFKKGLVLSHRGKHIPDGTPGAITCEGYGQHAHAAVPYGGSVLIESNDPERKYEGGDPGNLYDDGMLSNLKTFYQSIQKGDFSNSTVKYSVNSTLASMMARDAALQHRKITWTEYLKDTARIEVDTTGLKV